AFLKLVNSIDRALGLCRLVAEIDKCRNRIVDHRTARNATIGCSAIRPYCGGQVEPPRLIAQFTHESRGDLCAYPRDRIDTLDVFMADCRGQVFGCNYR